MDTSTRRSSQPNMGRRRAAMALAAVIVFVLAGVFGFFGFYSRTIDGTLYGERLNQMREVTTQLFSGLEDVVRGQWRIVDEKCATLELGRPADMPTLLKFMSKQAKIAKMDQVRCNLVAVDSDGWYYTQSGRQGMLGERDYLNAEPERISFVTNSVTGSETRMAFLQRLDAPVAVQDGSDTLEIIYFGISQDMRELNPYFDCKAYGGNSSVYVVDDDGLKLFSSSGGGDLLRGYNVLNTLRGMSYLHGSSFDDTIEKFRENHIAYSNAVLDDTELYYALYKMDSSAWTLIFLVPSRYVATNTVSLVDATVRAVLTFAAVLVTVSAAAILWLAGRQRRAAVAAERRNSAQLEKLNARLQSASKAKTEFLANMSHDIRTPMNAIVGIIGLMEHEGGLTDRQHTYIQKIQMSSKHLLSLINDVLDMSKIEASEVSLNEEPISLAEQVGQVESIVRPQTEERGQTFTIRVHTLRHEFLIGDSVRLRQVFLNLLSNAVKYTPYGGKVSLDIAELPCELPDRATIRTTVTDTGYGMTPEFLAHVFEPFTRSENSVTNKVQGTGLGMAITKSIVDMAGGTIQVESQVNRGTRFDVTLTMPIDGSDKRTVDATAVLLITDDQVLSSNVAESMQQSQVFFCWAADMEKAVPMLEDGEFDVILLAGCLWNPALSEIVSRLRQAAKKPVLIFCCDYAQREKVGDILRQGGVDGLIARPFFLSGLMSAIDQVRENVPAEDSHSVLRGMHFLCAEDNELNAEILTAVMEMNGASCVIYPNGAKLVEAFAAVRPGDFDAILMDVQMPVMNGLEATRAIRQGENSLGRTIPIIAMTANAFASDVQACLNAGMDAHVAKPLELSVLERALRNTGKFSGGGDICPQVKDAKRL